MLISIIVTLLVIGLLLWLVNNFFPMDDRIKQILNAVVIVFTIIWILTSSGLLHAIKF